MRDKIYKAIEAEVQRQETIWGKNTRPERRNMSFLEWFAILAEEVGEVAKEVNELHFREGNLSEFKGELIQVAAVAVSWLEVLE